MKTDKLLTGDLSAQASVTNVLYNCQVIAQEARESAIETPLTGICERLFVRAEQLGHGAEDMIGVIRAMASSQTSDPPHVAG